MFKYIFIIRMHFKTALYVILCVFGLSQQFTVCTEVTFAIPSPRGIFQDNKVISYEQFKKKIKKITNICIFSRET